MTTTQMLLDTVLARLPEVLRSDKQAQLLTVASVISGLIWYLQRRSTLSASRLRVFKVKSNNVVEVLEEAQRQVCSPEIAGLTICPCLSAAVVANPREVPS